MKDAIRKRRKDEKTGIYQRVDFDFWSYARISANAAGTKFRNNGNPGAVIGTNPNGGPVYFSAKNLAALIQDNGWKEGKGVFLIACRISDDFAKKLANILKVPVKIVFGGENMVLKDGKLLPGTTVKIINPD